MKPLLEYRLDIDGMRAVAVLGVLFYHLGVPPFGGGFVGVDIFFVISGYLISGIILAEAADGRFSFADFYTRRARRLLPALIATIAASFAAAAVLLSPEDLRRAALSTVAALFGVSNILFWRESGYFDVTGILKPLLHTWSLAVELQFYLAWPAFLLILRRCGQSWLIGGIVAAIVAGTAASLWALRVDPSAAFYLTPLRMNEFAAGALAVCAAPKISSRGAEALFAIGATGVVASLVLFSDLTPFPGFAALLPVSGTAAMLCGAPLASTSGWLRSRPAVHLGRISYSLYLVHWPLIVFVAYVRDRPLTPGLQFVLVVATLALAELSYRLVEKPLRKPRLGARRPNAIFYSGCVAAICMVAAPALQAGIGNGWVWRFPADLHALNSIDLEEQRRYVWDNFNRLQAERFTSAKRHVLVIGDSQAADLVNMLLAAGFSRQNEIITRTVGWECGMPYLPADQAEVFWTTQNAHTIKDPRLIDRCRKQYAAVTGKILAEAQYVIVGYAWRENALARIDAALRDLGTRTSATFLLAGAKTFDRSSVELVNAAGRLDGAEALAAQHVAPEARRINRFLQETFHNRLVDILGTICPREDFCHVLTDEQQPIYFDNNHLTRFGAEYLGRMAAGRLFRFLSAQ